MSELEASHTWELHMRVLWNEVGGFFLELQKDWDEKNLIKDIIRNDEAEYSRDYTAPFLWFEGPNYFLSRTTNLNIKALFRNSSGQQDGNGNGHFKPDGIFSGLQISNNQQMADQLWFAPSTTHIFFERHEWRVRCGIAGDVREAENAGGYNES